MKTATQGGVYIHIPFCSRKCDYCAFHSIVGEDAATQHRIIEKIEADARTFATEVSLEPATLYVGGGTPSTLPEGALAKVISGVCSAFGTHPSRLAEVSCEANPESASARFLDEAGEAGVTRISVGVQSLSARLCRELGRTATSPDELADIRTRWPAGLGADLISGIPGQTTEDLLSDIRALARIGFDHISVYDLSLEPGTALHRRLTSAPRTAGLPEPDWDLVCETIASFGYTRYEVSNFARPGFESLHNLGYWQMRPFIGLGPSATSTVAHRGAALRLVQPTDHSVYLTAHPLRDAAREPLSDEERIVEFLMLGLRISSGVTDARFSELFGKRIDALFGDRLRSLAARGYLVRDTTRSPHGASVRPTAKGMNLLNSLLEELVSDLPRDAHTGASATRNAPET